MDVYLLLLDVAQTIRAPRLRTSPKKNWCRRHWWSPYYNKPNRDGHSLVQAVCNVGLPVVLYHVPGRTGQRLSADILEELCRVAGVIGLKEATGDVTPVLSCAIAWHTNVSLLSGDIHFATLIRTGFTALSVYSPIHALPKLSRATAATNGSQRPDL